MKHVISGQSNEDVIEWRLLLDCDGEPMVQGRRSNGDWRNAFLVTGENAYAMEANCKALGLKAETF